MRKISVLDENDAAWLEAEAKRLERPVSFVARKAFHSQRLINSTGIAFDTDRTPEPTA